MDWFRLHAKILNDPRVQTLEPVVFKLYINALCHACLVEKDGNLGTLDDVSFAFRETKEAVSSAFHALTERGLIATVGETFHIPQWRKKQYKSDTSTERVKRHRKRYETVSETAPEQSRAETDSEQRKESSLRSEVRANGQGSPSKKKTALPEDCPCEDDKKKAIKYWLENKRSDIPIEREATKFRAHHEAKGTRAVSWPATWRTWYVNAVEFAPRSGATPARPDNSALLRLCE